ncbi:hypothetical protein SCA_1642 [Staphylococcus carnosus subsp. carnosus TM300]|uniref:Uncharacterized protein n=1 Tax=Staphylococcus carnosus (strain TM300) TaxID=396513 RepID=B9DMC5_STACT|nr:hypothetical protein SCA_1642 [Staphylococcus carnosus subsp. carnosus TM300]
MDTTKENDKKSAHFFGSHFFYQDKVLSGLCNF